MKTCREIEIQDLVTNKLVEREIFPYSVIFSYLGGESKGLLSITTFFPQQTQEILKMVDYEYECDKSGYFIFEETNTLLFSGSALLKLFEKL